MTIQDDLEQVEEFMNDEELSQEERDAWAQIYSQLLTEMLDNEEN